MVLKNTGVNAESLQFRRWRPQRCTETCQADRERWGRRECRVPRSALQTSTMCAIFKWLNDDKRVTFDYAVSLVDEWERTPADFERLQSAFYVHFGYDPMCHWHGLS